MMAIPRSAWGEGWGEGGPSAAPARSARVTTRVLSWVEVSAKGARSEPGPHGGRSPRQRAARFTRARRSAGSVTLRRKTRFVAGRRGFPTVSRPLGGTSMIGSSNAPCDPASGSTTAMRWRRRMSPSRSATHGRARARPSRPISRSAAAGERRNSPSRGRRWPGRTGWPGTACDVPANIPGTRLGSRCSASRPTACC